MNILFTHPTPFHPLTGGIGRVTDTLCRELQKRGHNIFYLNLSWYQESRKDFPYPAPVTLLPSPDPAAAENVSFYRDFLRRHKIDIVINQDGLYEGSYLFLNTGDPAIRTISVLHSNPIVDYDYLWSDYASLRENTLTERMKLVVRCALLPLVKRKIWRNTCNHYEFLRTNSSVIALLSPHYLHTIERIDPRLLPITRYIYNPNSYEEQLEIPEKQHEILIVGRLHRSKKIDRFLNVWSKVHSTHPDWHVSVIGDGPIRSSLEEQARRLKLQNIAFLGFRDPREYYQRASIICMTSDFEGFPMTLTEAMQFGCVPMAFSSFDAVNDLIIPGETGELVAPFNLNEYKTKLIRLMDDPRRRQQISRAAFAHVRQFAPEVIVEDWLKLFKEI